MSKDKWAKYLYSYDAKNCMKLKNYKDEWFTFLLNKKFIVIFIIMYICVSALGNFIDSLEKIKDGILYVAVRFEKKEMTDDGLITQSRTLAKEMSQYIQKRNIDEPPVDFNRYNESAGKMISYSSETVGYYYSEFEPKVAQYRQEYLKRGLQNKDVNDLYANPTNPLGIQAIASGLNDLASQLQAK